MLTVWHVRMIEGSSQTPPKKCNHTSCGEKHSYIAGEDAGFLYHNARSIEVIDRVSDNLYNSIERAMGGIRKTTMRKILTNAG